MSLPINSLYQLSQKDSLIVAGLMSGTSSDGIDVSLVKFRGEPTNLEKVDVLGCGSISFRAQTAKLLESKLTLSVEEVSVLNRLIAEDFAVALKEIETTHCQQADLVSSHGQTVFHHSSNFSTLSSNFPSTLQIGSGPILTVLTQRPVIYDFRQSDIALGGQGAPLTTVTDYYLYVARGKKDLDTTKNMPDAILNLGGISNLTILKDKFEQTIGFDCGPGNALIDRLVKIYTHNRKKYDQDGLIAKGGKVNEKFLEKLLSWDSFVRLKPPKSAGIENYGDEFIKKIISQFGKDTVTPDLIATVSAYTAVAVKFALNNFVNDLPKFIAVAGGGAKNTFLMLELKKRLEPIKVEVSDVVGISVDFREAIAFAFLGYAYIKGTKFNLSSITGSSKPTLLGAIALP